MGRPLQVVVEQILAAIEHVERFTADLDRDVFTADMRTRLAVERCLEIISEASRDVPEPVRGEHPKIEWRRLADAGNVYRHMYDKVDPDILWRTIADDLPPLKAAILAIRAKHVPQS